MSFYFETIVLSVSMAHRGIIILFLEDNKGYTKNVQRGFTPEWHLVELSNGLNRLAGNIYLMFIAI